MNIDDFFVERDIVKLWEKYSLPQYKRTHCTLVARVAGYFAKRLQDKGVVVNIRLLYRAALLHDIDRNVKKQKDERHPESSVRILKKERLDKEAEIVKTHSVDCIMRIQDAPNTWEQKLLYVADKMVKDRIITIDKRFALWRSESLPQQAYDMLSCAYPKAKQLEAEVYQAIGKTQEEVAEDIASSI